MQKLQSPAFLDYLGYYLQYTWKCSFLFDGFVKSIAFELLFNS